MNPDLFNECSMLFGLLEHCNKNPSYVTIGRLARERLDQIEREAKGAPVLAAAPAPEKSPEPAKMNEVPTGQHTPVDRR